MSEPKAAADGGPPTSDGAEPVLAGEGLVKYYGRVEALRGSDFELYPGEILAVIGDNGAGKSTLIRCLCGADIPDEGQLFLDGRPVHFRNVQQAKDAGIETVFQTLAVSPALDIASNLYLGREIRKPGPLGRVFRMLDTATMRRLAQDQVTRLGIETLQDITQAVETLSGGQRQAVAVARAAAFGSKVVILDEPTAALGVEQQRRVGELIDDLRSHGVPVILVSHNMPQVHEICDRVAVLYHGRVTADVAVRDVSIQDIVAWITGVPPQLST